MEFIPSGDLFAPVFNQTPPVTLTGGVLFSFKISLSTTGLWQGKSQLRIKVYVIVPGHPVP